MSDVMHKVLLTGGSGTVGRALRAALLAAGYSVKNLTRSPKSPDDIFWNPAAGVIDPVAVEGCDTVVHLAGEGIADHRWTSARKLAILESRLQGTTLLAATLANARVKPRLLISASGTGYYPLNTGKVYDESGPEGKSFLAEVSAAWEAATDTASEAGIRVVKLRLGVVLSSEGGALEKLVPMFNKGLGGPVSDGKQHLSWIALDDLIAVVMAAMKDERYQGPINAVAPESVSNAIFAKTLGTVLGKSATMTAPAFAVKLMYGQLGEETVLADLRVCPRKLTDLGFQWKYPLLEDALRRAVVGVAL